MNKSETSTSTTAEILSNTKTLDNLLLRTPYRCGTLLIDRVTYFEPDKYLSCIKNVTRNDNAYNVTDTDQYPSLHILEALTQACTIVGTYSSLDQSYSHEQNLLTEIDHVKFLRKVVAGDQLLISVNVIKKKPYLWTMEAEAWTDESIVAKAHLKFARA